MRVLKTIFLSITILIVLRNFSMAVAPQNIDVYRFDEKLSCRKSVSWRVEEGVPLAPLFVVSATNDIVALVRPLKGDRLILMRWTIDGKILLRRPLDLTEVIASFLESDGALLLVTGSELLRISSAGDGAIERYPLPADVKGNKKIQLVENGGWYDLHVAVGPHGAWFELKDRLVRLGFDGKTTVVPMPLYALFPAQGSVREYVQERHLLATADGGCLVGEYVVNEFPVKGGYHFDHAINSVLTLVDSAGAVRARSESGKIRTTWEWFWTEKSGTYTDLPSDMGLVRARHEGGGGCFVAVAERADGGFLLLTDDLICLDRSLKKIWKRSLGFAGGLEAISPSWSRGVLVSSGPNGFYAADNQGKGFRKVSYFDEAEKRRPYHDFPNIAVGQSPSGEWLVVEYGTWAPRSSYE
jgi:hypothetical protein